MAQAEQHDSTRGASNVTVFPRTFARTRPCNRKPGLLLLISNRLLELGEMELHRAVEARAGTLLDELEGRRHA